MAEPRFEKLRGGRGAPARLARHDHTYEVLRPVAERVLAEAKKDPNEHFTRALRMYRSVRIERGGSRRVRWNITSVSPLAERVEAKRGTMRRAAKAG